MGKQAEIDEVIARLKQQGLSPSFIARLRKRMEYEAKRRKRSALVFEVNNVGTGGGR